MFKIVDTADKTIDWPVVVEMAAAGGRTQKFEFTGIFKVLSDDQKKSIGGQIDKSEADESGEWKEPMIDRIMGFLADWKGVVDEQNQPLEFNRDNLRKAVRGPNGLCVLRAINSAIGQIESGSKAKN
jgi:hypothetical protein